MNLRSSMPLIPEPAMLTPKPPILNPKQALSKCLKLECCLRPSQTLHIPSFSRAPRGEGISPDVFQDEHWTRLTEIQDMLVSLNPQTEILEPGALSSPNARPETLIPRPVKGSQRSYPSALVETCATHYIASMSPNTKVLSVC